MLQWLIALFKIQAGSSFFPMEYHINARNLYIQYKMSWFTFVVRYTRTILSKVIMHYMVPCNLLWKCHNWIMLQYLSSCNSWWGYVLIRCSGSIQLAHNIEGTDVLANVCSFIVIAHVNNLICPILIIICVPMAGKDEWYSRISNQFDRFQCLVQYNQYS